MCEFDFQDQKQNPLSDMYVGSILFATLEILH